MGNQIVNIDVRGFDETMRKLRNMPDSLKVPALKAIARTHAKVIQKDAKNTVRQRSGTLAKSIIIRTGKGRNKRTQPYVWIGPGYGSKRKYDGFYGRFIEFGTKHMPATPFMRPAYLKNKRFVALSMSVAIHKIVAKQAAKKFKGSR